MTGRACAIGLLAAMLCAASAAAAGGLFEAAGVARQVEAWPELSVGARDHARARLDPEAFAWLEREVARAFAARVLREMLRDVEVLAGAGAASLARGFARSGAEGLLGPADGLAPAALREFPDFASRVSGGGLPPTRYGLIARVDESTGFGRNAWQSSAAVARAIARGARLLACAGGTDRETPLSAEETGGLAALAEPLRERVQVELLFHARDRSGAQLQTALRFLESEPAREFHRTLEFAVRAVLAEAMRGFVARVETEAARRCPTP